MTAPPNIEQLIDQAFDTEQSLGTAYRDLHPQFKTEWTDQERLRFVRLGNAWERAIRRFNRRVLLQENA